MDYYPETVCIYETDYATYDEYMAVLRDYVKHYRYKIKITDGWQFFADINALCTI